MACRRMTGHLAYQLVSAAKLAWEGALIIGYFLQKFVYCDLLPCFITVSANNLRQEHKKHHIIGERIEGNKKTAPFSPLPFSSVRKRCRNVIRRAALGGNAGVMFLLYRSSVRHETPFPRSIVDFCNNIINVVFGVYAGAADFILDCEY